MSEGRRRRAIRPESGRSTPFVISGEFHGLTTGAQVTITGVPGNTNANGTWTITVIETLVPLPEREYRRAERLYRLRHSDLGRPRLKRPGQRRLRRMLGPALVTAHARHAGLRALDLYINSGTLL